MAILQGILALISRSLGSILSALFGWAVVALFGPTKAKEKVWLSALVGAAAAWPLLLLGIAWPRVAAVVLTFVPLPSWVPSSAIRLAWIILAVLVPFALGMAVTMRSRGTAVPIPGTKRVRHMPATAADHSPLRESKVFRLLRGIPITVAIAASFLIVGLTVPLQRLLSMIRGQVDVDVPLVTDAQGYALVAREIAATLAHHGLDVQPSKPSWMITAPSRILARLGGPSFREYVPEYFAHFRGPRLEVMLYVNGLLLRGSEQDTAWAHGLLVEALTEAPAYQTFDPAAQDIERQIRSVWAVFRENPEAHVEARPLQVRLDEVAREIRELPVGYEEWQIVYRQALQLDRALRGHRQLLEATTKTDRSATQSPQETIMPNGTVHSLPMRELLGEITEKATLLAKKEIELAKSEIKADVQSELSVVKGLAVAALVLVLGLNMMLTALVLALAPHLAGWLVAILIGGTFLVIGVFVAYVSWSRRVTSPLAVTRKTLKDDAQWAKERLA